MDIVWWHWMVVGLGLVLAELALPFFFIIWFGLGALLVGGVLLIWPSTGLTAQILLWTLASIAMTVLWFKVFRAANTSRPTQTESALGEFGVLVRAIEPAGRSEVRFQKPVLGADTWPCMADEAIAANARVKVLAVDGQFLKVAKS